MSMLNMLATGTEAVTVADGVKECLTALGDITALITQYPFNIFFGCSILFIGIGVFGAVKRIF